jgi:hypothetical protein
MEMSMLPKTKQTEEFFQAFAKYLGNAKASKAVTRCEIRSELLFDRC